MDKHGLCAAAVSGAPARRLESDGASYLRCQSVTEVQDGGVVIVRALVETHVVLQGVPQLGGKQMAGENIVPIFIENFIWLSGTGCNERAC